MLDETQERWQVLCEQAANEQDPIRLVELVHEINELLAEKHKAGTQEEPSNAA